MGSHFRRTHTPLVVTLPAYSRAARSHTSVVLTHCSSSYGIRHAQRGLIAVLSHVLRGLVVLAVSITPGVVSSRSSHMPLPGLVVLAVFVTPGVISSRSSHTPCVGSLFSRYPSRLVWSHRDLLTRLCVGLLFLRYSSHLAWSRRGLLTCLVWARCSYRGGGCSAGSLVERGRSVERDNRLRGEESPD